MSRSLAALVSAACLTGMLGAATRDASAQPGNVDKQQKAKTAKEYVDAGLAAQDAKDFDTAIELYEKAYALVPHPVLLFNIGQAHRLAGRIDQAVTFYERYLAADPKGSQAATARALLDEIAAQKAAAQKQRDNARKAEEARKAEAARKARETREAEEASRAAEARKAEQARDATPPEPTDPGGTSDHPGRVLEYSGIAVGGAGVLGIAGSIWFGLRARSISDELSQPGAQFDPARVDDGEVAERNAIVFGIAGGALIAAGAVTYYLGYRRNAAAVTEHVTVLVRPGVVGLAIGGVLP